MKVLFAEDEEIVRIVGAEVLLSAGYEVVVAEDGRQAVELFDRFESEWGAVILDIVMPFLNGDKVFEHIHARRPELPVILASGFSIEEIEERFANRPIAGVLHKPYPCDDLVELVTTVVSASS